ncbi:DNA repair nucleotidyltransferase [Lysobacter arseniciresistens ZS79]|uniref:DNA repair nucleotidyltransferase n=1 Tax=Lysobacter arseniciresistens ZS79 TaxID=913325 RepID=A0A0A0F229_9GAMM|nr:DNA polymerase Y family protein [Lysobacter arseniciresistens]KGM57221.1 DNA repair nucleotidyltransferase [Lysobacter arseniciresistens ZS79]
MLWACILLPQLALDGVLRRHPDPDAPLALVTGPAQRRVLHAVNPAAKAAGLRAGQPLGTAQALCGRFATVEHDPAETDRWHDFLAAWAYRYSSLVCRTMPSALLLEVEASFKLFGPWPRFEAQLRADLAELGFHHRITLAPHPHAARALANVHDGLAVTDAAPLHNALGQLPVERSGLAPDVATALRRMGLRKLRQVLALPRAALGKRIGPDALAHLDRLTGALPAPLQCYQPPDSFESRIELNYDVESSQALLFPLRRLTTDLAAYLAGRDGGVQRFTVVLEHERCADSEITIGLLAPERSPAMLFELARGRLEQARVPAPVRGVRLVARELPPFVPAGRDLFDARPQQAVPWEQLRERLRARLGDDAVHGLAVRADHRPERAWQTEAGRAATAAPVPRPGWLLPQPAPLRDHHLTILAGPERIETGWWDGDVRRDYYLVETSPGQRAWAFRAAGDPAVAGRADGFMLHGWFG